MWHVTHGSEYCLWKVSDKAGNVPELEAKVAQLETALSEAEARVAAAQSALEEESARHRIDYDELDGMQSSMMEVLSQAQGTG